MLVEGEKFKLQKAAFKGLHRFVFFTAESLPCFETQPSEVFKASKVHDFEYYGERNYVLKWKFDLCY